MTNRGGYRRADPAIGPSFPRIFVAPNTWEAYPPGNIPPCDCCGETLAQVKGGYLMVMWESVTMHYCPKCLVKIASEIAKLKGVKL